MIVKQMTVGLLAVYCYIVACPETKEGIVIDPGGNEEEILDYCREEGITVRYLVSTHGHPDHVCGNRRLKEATGAEIVMHEEEAAFLARPEISSFFSQLGLGSSPPPDKIVKDGDTLKVGSLRLWVIHTPGHTPGGMCLYGRGQVFTGDTLFVGGVGRTDFPGGSSEVLLRSIKSGLLTLPPETVVWPGHGYGGSRSTIGKEVRSNSFLLGGF